MCQRWLVECRDLKSLRTIERPERIPIATTGLSNPSARMQNAAACCKRKGVAKVPRPPTDWGDRHDRNLRRKRARACERRRLAWPLPRGQAMALSSITRELLVVSARGQLSKVESSARSRGSLDKQHLERRLDATVIAQDRHEGVVVPECACALCSGRPLTGSSVTEVSRRGGCSKRVEEGARGCVRRSL